MTTRTALARIAMPACIALASVAAMGAAPSFKISQIYSNLDGTTQFIRLTETQGLNGQHHFAGLTLTSTHNGIAKQFVFPSDLPTDQTAHLSIIVAASRWEYLDVWPVTGGNYGWYYKPDFTLSARFLATDGGSIDFAGVDEVAYPSLPTDGENGVDHDLSVERAIVSTYYCIPVPGIPCGAVGIIDAGASVIEYYNASLDHYFYSASAPDIDALDNGRFAGWQRTGGYFFVAASGVFPVCRFYIPPPLGDSHFFSASREECDQVHARFPALKLETEAAFFVDLPDIGSGVCGTPWDYAWITPVYRLWNQRADSNHRYTTDKSVRDAMIARGYVAEGSGPDGVAFCAE